MKIPKRKIVAKTYDINGKKLTMKQIVDMKSWQDLRESLVGTWSENKEKNVNRLKKWLGPITKASLRKLLILRNYLTGSGFRWGNIQHPKIKSFRSSIVKEIKKRNNK